MLAGAFAKSGRASHALAIAVFVAPSVFLANVVGLLATDGWWYYANAGSLFIANALVLVGCAAFIGDAHHREGASLLRVARASSPPDAGQVSTWAARDRPAFGGVGARTPTGSRVA